MVWNNSRVSNENECSLGIISERGVCLVVNEGGFAFGN